ncbi:hypothetical protein [Photobacterium alginatilyticum]|uniref:N-acetyltransferase domain-containing protein n=1 Tax=Photobacterium alginatilyticum TaxID=1775171 RepID=A0ABW9YDJ4_9GAMM|nr:hypothetical protein [Photobacterium alginatilyticum]NBI51803.1 hypothetical protein [Photobacterium alginatilyticum]
MSNKEIQLFCQDLNMYLMERFNYKTGPATSNMFTIDASRKHFDLYLRFKPATDMWTSDTIVIAKIGFKHTRVGHGTDLLKFIVKVSNKYQTNNIGIEGANDSLANFAKNMGFENFQDKQWIIDIERLRTILK